MRLIVGLGNPDPEYQWTPHNLGFMAVDELANRSGIRVERPEGKALVGRGKIAGEEVILAKPQTYMNLSGISVRELLGKYELDVRDLLVLWDEAQLPLGTIRIHPDGSAGSHNGAKSVIGSVGTQEFARLRLGCGPDHPLGSRKEYVLRPMKKAELEIAAEMIGEAGDAVEMILSQGLDAAMTKYNRRKAAEPEEPEEKQKQICRFARLKIDLKRLRLVRGQSKKEVIMEERYYDLVFIVRPATPEEEIKKVLTVIEHTCAEKGGKIEKTEHWGTRKLAYRVAKHREGIYVHQEIRTTHGELIAELERRLRVQDNVIKYQTVRLDEDLKRQKKLSQKREKRAARRPRRTTPAPAPAAAAPAAPEQAAATS